MGESINLMTRLRTELSEEGHHHTKKVSLDMEPPPKG